MWYSIGEECPQVELDKIAVKMMLTFAESTHQVFRSTSPLSRGVLKSKGGGNCQFSFFRTIVSVNQLRLCEAVAEMCEECDSCHDRTGRLVVEGRSNHRSC